MEIRQKRRDATSGQLAAGFWSSPCDYGQIRYKRGVNLFAARVITKSALSRAIGSSPSYVHKPVEEGLRHTLDGITFSQLAEKARGPAESMYFI